MSSPSGIKVGSAWSEVVSAKAKEEERRKKEKKTMKECVNEFCVL
jgi:hypothetical protein